MNRPLMCVAVLVLVVSAYGLFQIKHKVKNVKKDLVEIHRQLAKDKEAIHVLKAEWAYLNQPERIKQLADQHLMLNHTASVQLKSEYQGKRRLANHYHSVTPTLRPIFASARGYE